MDFSLSRRALLAALCACTCASPAFAAAPLVGRPRGRPHVKLDRVELPPGLAHRDEYLRHLRATLRREVRRADWGASSKNTISLRFAVEKLTLVPRASALQVQCSALGELPQRRTARSQLSYGGELAAEVRLVKQVLEIVARGVVSRLSALERARRGMV
ncbi:MAG: hypothetical protein QM756_32120 [Polyangiaceae bacterium]